MASVAFGSTVAAAVAPTSGRTRPARRSVPPAATRGGPAPAKEEKGFGETILGFIFKKDQLLETDPLLNKVGGAPAAASSRAKPPPQGAATTAGKKAAGGDDGGSSGGFNLGGLGGFFAKKSS
ncbi:uncharacterized protein [Miscanthus floridulus]|uniref:uncharacterized protein n=1 Tax=Miscanthus floridulus TaxID=154761 RepID=UPI0034586ABC